MIKKEIMSELSYPIVGERGNGTGGSRMGTNHYHGNRQTCQSSGEEREETHGNRWWISGGIGHNVATRYVRLSKGTLGYIASRRSPRRRPSGPCAGWGTARHISFLYCYSCRRHSHALFHLFPTLRLPVLNRSDPSWTTRYRVTFLTGDFAVLGGRFQAIQFT